MAREAGTGARGRTVFEAFPDNVAAATLPRRALLARVSSWSHKKLPTDASKVEPPAHGRARVESSESLSR